MLKKIIKENWLQANAVIGIFPANSENDNINVYSKEGKELTSFKFLRQQNEKTDKKANLSLSDFIAPKESNITDYIGVFALTTGLGIEKKVKEFEDANDDYSAIMLKTLADRFAEAFTELLHKKVRTEYWGYEKELVSEDPAGFQNPQGLKPTDSQELKDLFKGKYQGIRPAIGYPACPEHSEKRVLFDLLNAEKNTGMSLTENFSMYPGASVSGLYFANPEAKFFNLGKISKEQVKDYANRKNISFELAEKYLGSNLGY
jgi:5-methyltetrahydrofolate--homocysteine methyltransferase